MPLLYPLPSSSELTIYVYADNGVDSASFFHTTTTLRMLGFDVRALNASSLIQGHWADHAYALVMPGGADIPYDKALRGRGNRIISHYVHNGGVYLGICAGAYYAAQHIVFDHPNAQLINENRELGFFPGTIQGPFWGPYTPHHPAGARAISIQSAHNASTSWHTYVHGGGQFCLPSASSSHTTSETYSLSLTSGYPKLSPLWIDDRGHWVAVICHVGAGQARLSAAHWEYMPHRMIGPHRCHHRRSMPVNDYDLWALNPSALWRAAVAIVGSGHETTVPLTS